MPIRGLFGTTVELLAKSIDLRNRSQNYIAANLANVETPGYTPTELSFEGELRSALKERGTGDTGVTNPRHIPLKGMGDLESVSGDVVADPSSSTGRDGNGVVMEREMSQLAENQLMYNASVQLISTKFEWLKYAIKGGN